MSLTLDSAPERMSEQVRITPLVLAGAREVPRLRSSVCAASSAANKDTKSSAEP